jgi:hypothetical protein
MSGFVYGTIRFIRALDYDELSKLSFELEKAAIDEGVFLQMGVNIVQRFIFEELGITRGWHAVEELPFLITDSPISNISEDLISPDAFGVPDHDWYQIIREHLLAIGRLLETITGLALVTGVTMYMTEGYGEDQEIRTEPQHLADAILEICDDVAIAPSVKIVVGDVS